MNDLYELAQVNIALLREPIDSELLEDFVSELDPVIVNMSVWESIEALANHVSRKHRFFPPASEAVADNNDDWLCPA